MMVYLSCTVRAEDNFKRGCSCNCENRPLKLVALWVNCILTGKYVETPNQGTPSSTLPDLARTYKIILEDFRNLVRVVLYKRVFAL